MKTIVFATHNANKVREVNAVLRAEGLEGWRVVSLDELGIADDVEENGTTFEENAHIKAQAAFKGSVAVAAEDSGLEVDALGGAPGVYSARYSGGHGNDDDNNRKVLRELGNTPMEKRTARYVCAMVCLLPTGEEWSFRGTCEGKIGYELTGDGGFGYDPMFYPDGYEKTFGVIPAEEKNAISHRGKAVRALAKWLKEKEDTYVEQ